MVAGSHEAFIAELVGKETLERISESMRSLGYRGNVRTAARLNRSPPIVVNIPWLDNPFYAEIARMTTPTLTTVNQPRYQMGFSACKMLMEIMDGTEGATSSMAFDTELVVRESTVRR